MKKNSREKMSMHTKSIKENVRSVLTDNGVLEDVRNVLEWDNPKRTGKIFSFGLGLYFINQIVGIGMLMIIGLVAIGQLLLFRILTKMQSHGLISKETDLQENYIAVPSPETFQTTLKICLEFIRITEETVKDVALSRDFFAFANAASLLLFTAVLGSFIKLPEVLLVGWISAFSFTIVTRLLRKNM